MYPMFIVALLTIARTWKQPNRPLKKEWIKEDFLINGAETMGHLYGRQN